MNHRPIMNHQVTLCFRRAIMNHQVELMSQLKKGWLVESTRWERMLRLSCRIEVAQAAGEAFELVEPKQTQLKRVVHCCQGRLHWLRLLEGLMLLAVLLLPLLLLLLELLLVRAPCAVRRSGRCRFLPWLPW
jgi:hypothetical protein